jgi:hypothetical protein
MQRRQWIKTRFTILIVFLILSLSVSIDLIFTPLALAQSTSTSSVEKNINFLIENTDNSFDVNLIIDRAVDIDNNTDRIYSSNSNDQPFDLGDLGKLVLHSESEVDLPKWIGLIGNRGAGEVSFSLRHEIEGIEIPPHIQFNLRGEVSDTDFLSQQGKLASIELTFEGILLKGIPEYLSKTKLIQELKQNGFELKIDSDNKATLSKVISILPEQQNLLNQLKDVEAKLNDNLQKIENVNSKDPSGSPPESRIKKYRAELKNYALERSRLISQIFKDIQFPCAPEFKRDIKFPIFERSASTSGSNVSASAAIGVSGDVVIEIKNPTCGFSMSSPFQFETWTSADIDITSHGFFGARSEGQASGDLGITFSDKYGSYPVSLEISPAEKQAFNGLVLKMLEKAQKDERILKSLQEQIDSKVVQISSSIQNELIGDGSNGSQICSLFEKLGLRTPNSQEDLICWAFNTTSPPLVLLPAPPLPPRPDGQCKAQLPLPPCKVTKQRICGVCKSCNFGVCVPIPCTSCSEQEIEIPPGCNAAKSSTEAINKTYKAICKRIQDWESAVNQIREDWEDKNSQINAEWTALSNQWNKYRDPTLVLAVAIKAINERILRPVDTRVVAQKLLDAAWQMSDWVDMTNDFVRNNVPESLSLNVRGLARVALTSQAHLLHARPKFKISSTLDIAQDGEPSLNLVFSGFQNAREDGSGGVGGLDVLGFTLSAEQVISFGGREIQKVEVQAEDSTPTFDKGKINLSNQEQTIYQESFRYR